MQLQFAVFGLIIYTTLAFVSIQFRIRLISQKWCSGEAKINQHHTI